MDQKKGEGLMEETKVLDHGYLRVVETWGSDERIIEAARMSTAKGFLGWGPKCTHCGLLESEKKDGWNNTCLEGHDFKGPGDEKLLAYLWNNQHATPFEMAGMIIEVQAPIFVFREWHRHRTQSYNELSARYTPLPDVNYVPSIERLLMNANGSNKQAGTVSDAAVLTHEGAMAYQLALKLQYKSAQDFYDLSLKGGVPKELARVHLPVGRYSRMRASANLRNWLSFLTLRSEKNPGAQWEIRQFANALGVYIAKAFPQTWKLFVGDAA